MNEAEVTGIMAAELTARGIPFAPSESEAAHLGVAYVAPVVPTAPAAAPAKPAATLTPEQQMAALNAPITGHDGDAILAEAMAPPATPDGYELPGLNPGQQFTPEQTALLSEARNALHGAGLPASVAKLVAARVNDGLANPPNDIQRAHSSAACTTALRQAWQGDFDANLTAVRAHVQALAVKSPNLISWLETSGAGNDPWVIRSLFNSMQARRAA